MSHSGFEEKADLRERVFVLALVLFCKTWISDLNIRKSEG